MNKKILLIIIMLFCFLFCSCGKEVEAKEKVEQKSTEKNINDKALTVKAWFPLYDSNDAKYIYQDSEIEIWNSENQKGFKEEDVQDELGVLIFDKVYTGSYGRTYSSFRYFENYLRREYKTSVGTFETRAADGKLIYYSGKKIQLFDHEISKDEAFDKSKEIAAMYVNNIDEYELSEHSVDDINESYYYFTYTRPLNGIETSERFTTGFTSEGICSGFSSVMVDEFNEFYASYSKEEIGLMTERLNSDEATQKLEEKINSFYGENTEYMIVKKTYTLLEDDSLALVCEVGIDPGYDENLGDKNGRYGPDVNNFDRGEVWMTICFESDL